MMKKKGKGEGGRGKKGKGEKGKGEKGEMGKWENGKKGKGEKGKGKRGKGEGGLPEVISRQGNLEVTIQDRANSSPLYRRIRSSCSGCAGRDRSKVPPDQQSNRGAGLAWGCPRARGPLGTERSRRNLYDTHVRFPRNRLSWHRSMSALFCSNASRQCSL